MEKIVMEKLTYTVPEAAKVLGVSVSKMYELARSEGFPAIQIGNRKLVSRKGLDRWVDIKTQQALAMLEAVGG